SVLELVRLCRFPELYTDGEPRLGTKDEWNNARHVHLELTRLAGIEWANVTRTSGEYPPSVFNNSIYIAQLFLTPQVVLMNFSSVSEERTAVTLAKIALYLALDVADVIATAKRINPSIRTIPVFFLFDESSSLISSTFASVLPIA